MGNFARIPNSWLTYTRSDLCPPKSICPRVKVAVCRKHSGMDAMAATHLNIISTRFCIFFTHAAKGGCLGCVWYFWFIITQTNCYMLVADCCLLALGTAGWENNAVWQDNTVFFPPPFYVILSSFCSFQHHCLSPNLSSVDCLRVKRNDG